MPTRFNHLSQRTLRKLADRAIIVVRRHRDADQTIAVIEPTIAASCTAFITAYDAARTFEARQLATMAQGRTALLSLHTRIRAWVGMLIEDIPSFGAADLDGTIEQPEHLFADAKRIVETLQAQTTPLPYAEELARDLTAHGESARTEWTAARDAMVRLQELRAVARTAGLDCGKRLIALRRILRAVLGTSHHDYQALRASRAFEARDDEPLEPAPIAAQPAVQPAAQPASAPTPSAATNGISLPAVPAA